MAAYGRLGIKLNWAEASQLLTQIRAFTIHHKRAPAESELLQFYARSNCLEAIEPHYCQSVPAATLLAV